MPVVPANRLPTYAIATYKRFRDSMREAREGEKMQVHYNDRIFDMSESAVALAVLAGVTIVELNDDWWPEMAMSHGITFPCVETFEDGEVQRRWVIVERKK